jgi:protein-S-isoprenylcysteine O-methyltransferase Ste14
MTLQGRVIRRFGIATVVSAALLFLPAGSLRYWQGWVFLGLTWGFLIPAVLYITKRDPQLMERRMRMKEKEPEQQVFKVVAGLIYFPAFLLPGLDFRFGWSRAWLGPVPVGVVLAAQAVTVAGYGLAFWVMRVNTFASRTIQVEPGQKVVASGPYAVVRHPMYAGMVLMMLTTPLALGSYVALPFFALMVPLIAYRLISEEKVLRRDLGGYAEYCERTRFRLVPGVW